MKANELRIGNLVGFNGKIEEVDVLLRIMKDYGLVVFVGADNPVKMEYLQPIPIAEEILVKIGFEKTEVISEKNVSYYSLRLSDDKYIDLCLITNERNYGVLYLFPYGNEFEFKYVHELQNFYFALTGEELNVSEILTQSISK